MFYGKLTGYTKSGALVSKKFLEFFFPTLLMSMSLQLGIVLDGIVVSYLISPDAMASVGASLPLNQTAAALAIMISVGATGYITSLLGAGNKDEANRIFSTVCALSVGIGCIITVILSPFSWALSEIISPAHSMTQGCYDYLHVLVFRFPFSIALMVMCSIVRSDGMAALSSNSVIVQQASNLIMDFIFIRYFGLGLEGAALATMMSDIAGIFFLLSVYFRSKERTLRLANPFSDGIMRFIARTAEIFRSGLSAAIGAVCVAVKVWFLYRILGLTGGADAVKIYAACMLFLSFMSMFINGTNQAALPVIGVLYGEKDYNSIRMLVRYTFRFTMIIAGFFVALAFLFPKELLMICKIPEQLAAAGTTEVRLFALSLLGVGITFLMIYYYTAVKQNTAGKILSLTEGFFAVIPAAWIFPRFMGQIGVWAALVFAEIAGAVATMIYVKYKCSHSGGELTDFYLIGKNGSDLLYDVSLKATEQDAAKLSQEAINTLEANGMDSNTAVKAGVALEEITANMALINAKPVDLDVRIFAHEDEILLALRDNGTEFNPIEYQPPEELGEFYRTDRIIVLRALSGEIKYDRVLSLNQTLITIHMTVNRV